MRKKTVAVLMLILATVLYAAVGHADPETVAASGMCGPEAEWTITSDGVLTISGAGDIDPNGEGIDPDSLTLWNEEAKKAREIVIESGITGIGEAAFDAFPELAALRIPDTVTGINMSDGLCKACPKLAEITVDSENPDFYDEDGVLYAENELYRYPPIQRN